MTVLNRISKVISPLSSNIKGSSVSVSQKLFSELGLVHFNHGVGTLMPLLLKSLRKLETLVRKEMKQISALEFKLPILTHSDLYKTSGRLNLPDLFKVHIDKEKSYILSPTCEEAVTHVLKSYQAITHKNLPIRLYQICNKFRDEMRPRSGLLRAHEFLMKDLYCFDPDEESCEQCYQEIINQYHHFFNLLKVPYVCVEASSGSIGGLKSHEFHFLANAGQDKLVLCKNCGHNENLELNKDKLETKCSKCQSSNVIINNGIEVGHAFKIGTKFTQPFGVTYQTKNNTKEILQMSSFGLGLTRILAACVEVLSKPDGIKWPMALAPYLVCVLPPKAGSKEEVAAKDIPQHVYHNLNNLFEDEVVIDDVNYQSLGKRIHNKKKLGIPYLVVLGKSLCNNPPTAEVIDLSTGSEDLVQIPDINQFIMDKLQGNYKNQNYRENLNA